MPYIGVHNMFKYLIVVLFAVTGNAFAEESEVRIAYQDHNGPVFALEHCTAVSCVVESSGVVVSHDQVVRQLPVVATTGCHSTGGICVLAEGYAYGVTQEAKDRLL